jgi:hypothetical protein
VLQVVAERLQIFFSREALVVAAPLRDRVDDAADELLDAALTLGRPDLPAEIRDDRLVACCDHDFGISTSRCSNTTSPPWLPMTAERSSHSISSNGSTPASVKNRWNVSPGAAAFFARGLSVSTLIGT